MKELKTVWVIKHFGNCEDGSDCGVELYNTKEDAKKRFDEIRKEVKAFWDDEIEFYEDYTDETSFMFAKNSDPNFYEQVVLEEIEIH